MPSRSIIANASRSHHSCCLPSKCYPPAGSACGAAGRSDGAAANEFKEPSVSQDCSARGGLDYLRALPARPGNCILFRPSKVMAASPESLANIWRVSILNGHRNVFLITPKGHYTFLRPGEDSTSPFGIFPFLPHK